MHRIDNPTVPIAYTSEPEVTMLPVTGLTDGDGDGIPDELESAVADDIGGYCGAGGVMGDADGDGISNDIEVRLGLECRVGEPGSAIAQAGEISLTVEDLAPGATAPSGISSILIPGTGEMTGINLKAVDCAGCDAIHAYRVMSNSRSLLRGALGSFSTGVMWVGMNNGAPIAVIGRQIYVAPPVGFDVGVVSADSGETTVDLTISVAVSPGAGGFSVGDLMVSGATLASGLGTGSGEQLSNQITVSITVPSLVRLTAIGDFMFTSGDLVAMVPSSVTSTTLDNNELFSIGNERVRVVQRLIEISSDEEIMAANMEVTRNRGPSLSATMSAVIQQSNAPVYRGEQAFAEASTDITVTDNDSTALMTAGDQNITIERGVFDYSVALGIENAGGTAAVVLRLLSPAERDSEVYKFNGVMWVPFYTMGLSEHDRVYSALASDGQCPVLGGSRQPDPNPDLAPMMDPGVGGDHEYAWNLAVFDGNNVRKDDECLLVEILDGSDNDDDEQANGVVDDPIALTEIDDDDRGGGSMDPIWLLLLALSMALSYGLRRRQSSPFISDL